MTPKRNTDQILISCARVLSHFSHVQLFVTPWSTAHQALFMGFSRQEHWSGLPCPLPGDLPNPGIEPASPVTSALQADSIPLSQQGSPKPAVQPNKTIPSMFIAALFTIAKR